MRKSLLSNWYTDNWLWQAIRYNFTISMHVSVSDNNVMCVLFMYGPVSMSVRPCVHKKFSDLNEIWCAGSGRWVIHDGMPYDPIQGQGQGQGHRDPKVAKMADFKIYLFRRYACNQKTNGELWYSKTIFELLIFIAYVTWPLNLLFHLWQRNFASRWVDRQLWGSFYHRSSDTV